MFNKQTGYIEGNGFVGQIDFPFRVVGGNLFRAAFEIIAKPIMSIMLFGFLPLAFLLFGIHIIPGGWKNAYALLMGLLVVASIPLSWTFKREAIYRIDSGTFENYVYILGYKFRSWVWPRTLFTGISYGNKGLDSARTSVVRLKCKVEGYLVDSFFYAHNTSEAEELARRLSVLSGLPVIGQEFTGPQHNLNDLRRNAWLTAKYAGLNKDET